MFNGAGIRKIEVADAISCPGRIAHPVVDLLISFKGFWEGQIQEGMSGARQPKTREISLGQNISPKTKTWIRIVYIEGGF